MPLDFEAKNKAVIEMAKKILGGSGHSKNAFTQCTRLCQRYSTGALSAQFYVQVLIGSLTIFITAFTNRD